MLGYSVLCDDTFIDSIYEATQSVKGGLAQMVERSLSMREVPGSIPGFSTFLYFPPYFEAKMLAFNLFHKLAAQKSHCTIDVNITTADDKACLLDSLQIKIISLK